MCRRRRIADLPVWNDVIGAVEVKFVYLVFGHELVDLDGALTLKRNGLQLFGLNLDVLALGIGPCRLRTL